VTSADGAIVTVLHSRGRGRARFYRQGR
jgi:hypothetical protein